MRARISSRSPSPSFEARERLGWPLPQNLSTLQALHVNSAGPTRLGARFLASGAQPQDFILFQQRYLQVIVRGYRYTQLLGD